jgi:F0F1-type ATP synthase gamma subunit
MNTKKNVVKEIEDLGTFKTVVETYEEIGASRIKKIRDSVLKSRFFVEDLNLIFSEIKSNYKKQIDILMKTHNIKDQTKLSFYQRNGKTLYLLISANTGFYGSIVRETFDLFKKEMEGKEIDIAIIGKQGLGYYLNAGIKKEYKYFDFPDSGIDEAVFKQLINFIIGYQKTVVFFGKLQSLVAQKAAMTDISGNLEEINSQNKSYQKYFFEPSIEKVLAFFEQEIFTSIFEQTIKESQLAKLGARIVSLDSSVDNIRNKLIEMSQERNKLSHQESNKKQMQTLSSMKLWSRIR